MITKNELLSQDAYDNIIFNIRNILGYYIYDDNIIDSLVDKFSENIHYDIGVEV